VDLVSALLEHFYQLSHGLVKEHNHVEYCV